MLVVDVISGVVLLVLLVNFLVVFILVFRVLFFVLLLCVIGRLYIGYVRFFFVSYGFIYL